MERSQKFEELRVDIWVCLNSGMELDDIQNLLNHKYENEYTPLVISVQVSLLAMKDFCSQEINWREMKVCQPQNSD